MAANEVRIIGGMWKGRKLSFPATKHLRPTLGRAREGLFNWLVADIRDARCLDLFAGSGALGFEALSRGAADVTFVEQDRKVARSLRSNVSTLDTSKARVFAESAERFLRRGEGPWDIVFLDPPFGGDKLPGILREMLRGGALHSSSIVYFEHARSEQFTPDQPWSIHREARAGDTHFGLLQAEPSRLSP